jgi:dTDP-4-dehydrorhamnose 3,5-epimerase
MKFVEASLRGVFIIEPECVEDERGFFARTWCRREFESHGLNSRLVQCNISFNKKKNTLRGMHYQALPHEETKLIRCTQGSVFDVIIDLRPDSRTYKHYMSIRLTAQNHVLLYIPGGFAHGFQTLEDDSEVFYQMSEFYYPESARGVRWDDPAFGIEWPDAAGRILSERDRNWPDYNR